MITLDEVVHVPILTLLPEHLRFRMLSRAAEMHVRGGEWLAHDGDPAYFWIVLEGEVETIKIVAGEAQQMTTFDPGEYFGEVPIMLGANAMMGIRAINDSRMMRMDPADFHGMVHESPEVWQLLSQSLVRRVNYLRDAYVMTNVIQATIVGNRYDSACHELREFLSRNQITFEWLDPTVACDVQAIPDAVMRENAFPAVLLAHDRVLYAPTNRELARALGLQIEPLHKTYDVAIIGGGPSGLASAVYGGSEGLRTIMIEREAPGGQAGTSSRIENYLGFPGGLSGGDLANRALLQAKRFGCEILVTRRVIEIVPGPASHRIVLDDDTAIEAKTVVLAMGVVWRTLDAPGVAELVGRGVYYGAARTEALAMRGKDIFLVGGGNSAGQAAMFFANYARSVTILIRADALAKSMSHYLIEQLATRSNINLETRTIVTAAHGATRLESITTHCAATNETRTRIAEGLFVFIGASAETAWLPPGLVCDNHGYICTGHDIQDWHGDRAPFPLETKVPGIFAAGDVRSGSVKRVASGVGEGSMVIAFVHQYLALSELQAVS